MKVGVGTPQIKRWTAKRWPVARAASSASSATGLSLPASLTAQEHAFECPAEVLSRIHRAARWEAWNAAEATCPRPGARGPLRPPRSCAHLLTRPAKVREGLCKDRALSTSVIKTVKPLPRSKEKSRQHA